MSNKEYFGFLGTVWDHLDNKDKDRFGELWHAYEQVLATVTQGMVENNLNVAVQDLLPYQTIRWLQYQFLPTSMVIRNPVYTSSQDLSVGVRTDTHYLLKFLIDNTQTVEVDIRGIGIVSSINDIIAKINAACGFAFARGVFENTVIQLVSPTAGVNSGIKILPTSDPTKNAAEFVLGVLTTPFEVPYYPYAFTTEYTNIVEIRDLRTKVRDESDNQTKLSATTDYIVEANSIIAFKEIPPTVMWAKTTKFDEETPWHNFGFLMGIYQPNVPSYRSVIQGLWHAFWTGPRPESIRTSLYLLFGLPVAQEESVVTSLTPTEIQTTSDSGVLRTYTIPVDLVATVTLGQRVIKFQPLVDGIAVYDKVNLPGFIQTEIGRDGIQKFLTENATRGTGDTDETRALLMLEEHTFLPQISVNAFVSSNINLGNIKLFLESIRPLHKTFLSQIIIGEFRDNIGLLDRIGIDIGIDITPNLDSNQTTFLDQTSLDNYETLDNDGLNLDSEVVLGQERLAVEVFSFGVLIDSFTA